MTIVSCRRHFQPGPAQPARDSSAAAPESRCCAEILVLGVGTRLNGGESEGEGLRWVGGSSREREEGREYGGRRSAFAVEKAGNEGKRFLELGAGLYN